MRGPGALDCITACALRLIHVWHGKSRPTGKSDRNMSTSLLAVSTPDSWESLISRIREELMSKSQHTKPQLLTDNSSWSMSSLPATSLSRDLIHGWLQIYRVTVDFFKPINYYRLRSEVIAFRLVSLAVGISMI